MSELLKGVELRKKNGKHENGDIALKGKVVALYFSAHWCGPCRKFTPQLKPFEIVFVSSDETEDDMKAYIDESHGDWWYIPFDDESTKTLLEEKYRVEGIPMVVLIKANGDIVNADACDDIRIEDGETKKSPIDIYQSWKPIVE